MTATCDRNPVVALLSFNRVSFLNGFSYISLVILALLCINLVRLSFNIYHITYQLGYEQFQKVYSQT